MTAMTASTRVEIRKSLDTRNGQILAVLLVMSAIAIIVAVMAFEERTAAKQALTLAMVPLFIIVPIISISSFTSEWSQRGGLTTFGANPRRLRVATSKLVATVLLAGAYVLIITASALVSALIFSFFKVGELDYAAFLGFGGGAMSQLVTLVLNALLGAAIGSLVPVTSASIVIFFIFSGAVDGLASNLGSVAQYFQFNAAVANLGSGLKLDYLPSISAVVFWVVLPLILGFWRFTRREVK